MVLKCSRKKILLVLALFLNFWLLVTGRHGLRAAEPVVTAADLPRVPATESSGAVQTFQVRPGFRIELVAAEPLVLDPIAMSFDEKGRLFVVEMRDYSERREERLGRIRLLEDTDADGRFDKSSIYAKDLPWPTAVICYGGGVFIGANPDILFFKDTNGDGIADVREVVFTGFGSGNERLNVQQLLNSFNWGLDNRIHGASGGNGGKITSPKFPERPAVDVRGRDFSFDPRTLEIRLETGGAQNGLSFDDAGRKFVCSNSAHIQTLMYEDFYAGRNTAFALPNPLVNIAEDGPAAEVFRISPDEPWRVIRTKWRVSGLVSGPIEGGGRPSGYFTGATGVTIYRGDSWPEEYRGDAFIADCGSNLIHRKKLFPDGVGLIARRAADELKSEFVASKDNWFRPANFANAPDGTLYVADMYREVIEHPWSLPESLKKFLDLNSGNDRGRIYRIVPNGFKQPKLPRLADATTDELVKTLEHSNGWHRDTAARLLYQRQDRSAIPALEKVLSESTSGLARMHALHALRGLNALKTDHLIRGIADANAVVREHALRLSRNFPASGQSDSDLLQNKMAALAIDPAPRVRYQLAFLAGDLSASRKTGVLSTLAGHDYRDPWMRAAILHSLGDQIGYGFLLSILLKSGGSPNAAVTADNSALQEFVAQVIGLMASQKKAQDVSLTVSYLAGINNPTQTLILARPLMDGLRRSGMSVASLEPSAQTHLKEIQRRALASAPDKSEPEGQRVPAIQFLGTLDWAEAGETLSNLLDGQPSSAVQQAAVAALARFKEPQAAAALIQHWAILPPRSRSETLAGLLSRRQQIPVLLEGVEKQMVQKSDLTAVQLNLLRTHKDAAIRDRAIRLWGEKERATRDEVVRQFQDALQLAGNAERGKKIFMERCSSCHRIGKEGYAVGPDLASVRANGKEKLLVSILDPNREVSPAYLNYAVETKDGETWMGLIAADTGAGLTLRRAFGDETAVPRASIQRIQSLSQSVMPEGLEGGLKSQELADLLEFIVAGDQR